MQGKLDDQKLRDIQRMLAGVSENQVAALVDFYQAQELARAKDNLRRLQAYRDALKREVDWRIAISRQDQAMAAVRPAIGTQYLQSPPSVFYPAPPAVYAMPYYIQPGAAYPAYGYVPYGRYHRRYW